MKKISHVLYKAIPFKKALFSLLKKVWIPPKNVVQHLHFTGVIKINDATGRGFYMKHHGYMIENELFWYGLHEAWERISFSLWAELSKDATVIFDIGANTGVYSLISGSANPNAKIYAFEPIKSVFEKLNMNVGLNVFNHNVKTHEVAVSNYTGTATIYLEKNATHALSVTVNKSLLPPGVEQRSENIQTIRLDEFIEMNRLTHIDLMKIDVETHEPEVLSGMGTYIEKFRPSILIEILDDEIGEKVQKLVENLNYLYFNIDEKSGLIQQTAVIRKSAYFNYLICSEERAQRLKLI